MTADLPPLADRVEAGAEFLDERVPGWAARIDLTRLDLKNGCNCILGQIHDDSVSPGDEDTRYYWECVRLGLTEDDAFPLGFSLPGNRFAWAELDGLWTAQVRARQGARS